MRQSFVLQARNGEPGALEACAVQLGIGPEPPGNGSAQGGALPPLPPPLTLHALSPPLLKLQPLRC